jgi:hypothetical protein
MLFFAVNVHSKEVELNITELVITVIAEEPIERLSGAIVRRHSYTRRHPSQKPWPLRVRL